MGYTSEPSSSTLLVDMDTLVSTHKPRSASSASATSAPMNMARPPPLRSTDCGFRPGATSNCASRYARHRRHSSASSSTSNSTRGSSRRTTTTRVLEIPNNETCFFVGDEDLLSSVVVLDNNGDVTMTNSNERQSSRASRSSRRTTETTATASSERGSSSTRVHRSSSLPVAHEPSQHLESQRSLPTHLQSDRFSEMPKKTKRRKMVTFKNAYEPEIMPDRRPTVQSYDELLFNVGGLYHTLSYLHDADFYEDAGDPHTDTNSDSSSSDKQMQMERSMTLMIAEFLYRSAVYLGYPPDDNVWVPGFREKKKFSSNDVKRWRRLAHFDWDQEEAAFEMERAQRRALARQRAREVMIVRERARASSTGLRATVSDWLTRHRRPSSRDLSAATSSALVLLADKPLPALVLEPPLVPTAKDLTRLVEIANSCISYGAFRFTERQIRKLCNVPIKH